MGILSWLVLGAFSGWIASIIMNKNESMGAVANIFTGIVEVTGLNLHSVIVSVVGACILLWILNKFNKK